LAALLHDIGKPSTRRFEGSKVTFHHHDVVGAKQVKRRLRALAYPNAVVKSVARLTELHLRFHGYGEGQWSDSAVRRYVRDAGDELERLHILTRSDCTTRNKDKATRLRRNYEELEWRIDELAKAEELGSLRPDLDGTQIMSILDIPAGREVGEAYRFLMEHRLEHGPADAEAAETLLRDWWDARTSRS
ncbi:MAG: HDIG domain-containing metalloprotein, partial [Arachnia sp.]